MTLGREAQGLEAHDSAFLRAIKAQGPRGEKTTSILNTYWGMLRTCKGLEAAEKLKQRARVLGCDVRAACVGSDEFTMRNLLGQL